MNANTASKTKTTLSHTHTNRDIVPPDGEKKTNASKTSKKAATLFCPWVEGVKGVLFFCLSFAPPVVSWCIFLV